MLTAPMCARCLGSTGGREGGGWGGISFILESCPTALAFPVPSRLDRNWCHLIPHHSPPVTVFSGRGGAGRSSPCRAGWRWDSLVLFRPSSDVEVPFPGAGGRGKWSREKCSFSLFGERMYHILGEINCFWVHLAAFVLWTQLLCG